MFFKKSEHKRSHPYVALTIGTLAMIGAFSVVRCGKKRIKTMCHTVRSFVKRKSEEGCCLCDE